MVDIGKRGAGPHPGGLLVGIDPDAIHRFEIDHQAMITDGISRDIVASAFDREQQVVLAGEVHRSDYIGRAGTPYDDPGFSVDHVVPDRPSLLVVGLSWEESITAKSGGELLNRLLVDLAYLLCHGG